MSARKQPTVNKPLRFPAGDYTEKIAIVNTSTGEVKITYCLFEHFTYVANPIDAEFQSLNVKAPLRLVAGMLMLRTPLLPPVCYFSLRSAIAFSSTVKASEKDLTPSSSSWLVTVSMKIPSVSRSASTWHAPSRFSSRLGRTLP